MKGREVALEVLTRMEKGKGFIDNILEGALRRHQLTELDRRFIQEITYGVTKLKKHLDYIIDGVSKKRKARPVVRNVLRMGVYQILFMSKVPDYAAVDESVKLIKQKDSRLAGFVNALLRKIVQEGHRVLFPDPAKEPAKHLSTFYSHPEWLVQKWLKRHGYNQTKELCRVNNTVPRLSIRVNTLRISSQKLLERLRKEGAEAIPGRYIDYVYYLAIDKPIVKLSSFQEGLFQVQDESAVLVGELFDAKPGESIVDLCASPGGKSTHLAQLIEDDGLVVAVDVSMMRLRPLIENLKRLGIRSIRPVVSDSRYFRVKNCDGILLDVPCSGSGTLRRRPDLRWRMSEDDIKALTQIQLKLLENGASFLKVGGRLVYSTCSIEPNENEDVVHRFLSTHHHFSLEPIPERFPKELVRDGYYLSTYPHRHGLDGTFGCLLRKTGNPA